MLQAVTRRRHAAALPARHQTGEHSALCTNTAGEPFKGAALITPTRSGFQGYTSHSDEDDPERIQMIIQRAVADAGWVLDKVGMKALFYFI